MAKDPEIGGKLLEELKAEFAARGKTPQKVAEPDPNGRPARILEIETPRDARNRPVGKILSVEFLDAAEKPRATVITRFAYVKNVEVGMDYLLPLRVYEHFEADYRLTSFAKPYNPS